jgi:hypothetical protein
MENNVRTSCGLAGKISAGADARNLVDVDRALMEPRGVQKLSQPSVVG